MSRVVPCRAVFRGRAFYGNYRVNVEDRRSWPPRLRIPLAAWPSLPPKPGVKRDKVLKPARNRPANDKRPRDCISIGRCRGGWQEILSRGWRARGDEPAPPP